MGNILSPRKKVNAYTPPVVEAEPAVVDDVGFRPPPKTNANSATVAVVIPTTIDSPSITSATLTITNTPIASSITPAKHIDAVESPVVNETIALDPVVIKPVVAEPVAVEPVVAEPVAVEPVVPEPVVPEPVAAEPVVVVPVAVEPVVIKPVAAEPVVVVPVAVEPVVIKPVAAEPVAVEPVAAVAEFDNSPFMTEFNTIFMPEISYLSTLVYAPPSSVRNSPPYSPTLLTSSVADIESGTHSDGGISEVD